MKEQRPRLISQGRNTALETETALVPFTTVQETAANALGFIHCGCPRAKVIMPAESTMTAIELFTNLLELLVEPGEFFEIKSDRIVEIWREPKVRPAKGGEKPTKQLPANRSFDEFMFQTMVTNGKELDFEGLKLLGHFLARMPIHSMYASLIASWSEICDELLNNTEVSSRARLFVLRANVRDILITRRALVDRQSPRA